MSTVIWLFAANCALTMLYVIVKSARQEGVGIAIFFIFLPGLGFLVYFLPELLRVFLGKVGVDREAVLTHVFAIERQPEHPDVREALNVVPVEDAMAIGSNTEKRALLLKQLKKSLTENYKILLVAEQDEDSESVHYVAAAKMEVYRLHQARWLECRKDYEREPDNPEAYHTACTVLIEMLASGVLSSREQSAYQKRLCTFVQEQINTKESEVSSGEYEAYLSSLVELGQHADAEVLWQKYADRMQSEEAYHTMAKMFYQTGERQKLENILNDLCDNRKIRLSPQGLERLRYWTNRLVEVTADN